MVMGCVPSAFATTMSPKPVGSSGWRGFAAFANGLSHPLPAGFLHGLALWLWHAPAAFEAALASYPLHALEHATFFGTAILFWRAILNARHGTRLARRPGRKRTRNC